MAIREAYIEPDGEHPDRYYLAIQGEKNWDRTGRGLLTVADVRKIAEAANTFLADHPEAANDED